jgi:Asp-tRNA(Asn)/Glu-tRNA(Gln) amidotransferase C subunit
MIRLCVDPAHCAEVCSMAAAYSDMAAQLADALSLVQQLRAALMTQEATTAAVMADNDRLRCDVAFHYDGYRMQCKEATR